VNDLISDGTRLLDLVEFLEEREVAFVLSHRHIDGYVHFSDFNHHLVKLTFYVILEAAERWLDSVRRVMGSDQYLRRNLSPHRTDECSTTQNQCPGRNFGAPVQIA
jgi:hypothetical protein